MERTNTNVSTPAFPRRPRATLRPVLQMPRLSADLVAGILRESGVPEDEARQRIDQDPELRAELRESLRLRRAARAVG
jgi:hypothetical protein